MSLARDLESLRNLHDGDTRQFVPNPAELDRIHRTSAETHGKLALALWRHAELLGHAIRTVELMGDHDWPCIADEDEAADRVVIDGPGVAKALRALAMRLDRSVMVRAGVDE